MNEVKEFAYSTFTFSSTDDTVTASVMMDVTGDVFIQMKPHGKLSESEMYELLNSMGFKEVVEPLRC